MFVSCEMQRVHLSLFFLFFFLLFVKYEERVSFRKSFFSWKCGDRPSILIKGAFVWPVSAEKVRIMEIHGIVESTFDAAAFP